MWHLFWLGIGPKSTMHLVKVKLLTFIIMCTVKVKILAGNLISLFSLMTNCIYIFTGLLLHNFAGVQLYIIILSEAVRYLAPHMNSIRHFKVEMLHCGTIPSEDNLIYLSSNPESLSKNNKKQWYFYGFLEAPSP